jgi:RNA polymerase sigma factor (sigma-70 family)
VSLRQQTSKRGHFRSHLDSTLEFFINVRANLTASRLPLPPEMARWFADEILPHEEALRNWLRMRFPSVADRDDVIQDAYVRVWKSRSQGPVACPKALLFTVARNLALNRVRHSYYEPNVGEMDRSGVLDDGPCISDQVARREEYALLSKALESLPDRCRDVLVLRRIYGYSQKEIAARLQISEKTVEAQSMTGMKKLIRFFGALNHIAGRREPAASALSLPEVARPTSHA